MASEYALRIVHLPSGTCVEIAPGREAEVDLVNDLCNRVRAKGVGILRTEEHVIADVCAAFNESLMSLKSRV